MGFEWNNLIFNEENSHAYGYPAYDLNPLVNYTTREVCSANNPAVRPHPDQAELVGTIIGRDGNTAYCYTGPGAALNDIKGMERDATGRYLKGQRYLPRHCVRRVPGSGRQAACHA